MGWSLVACAVALAASLGGCAFLTGIGDATELPDPADDSDAGGTPVRTNDSGADAVPGACPMPAPNAALESGSLFHASKVVTPVNVNGENGEWACVDRFSFDVGQRAINVMAGHDTAEIAMQWDEEHVYLMANVTTDSPGGTTAANQNFKNDSLHLFLAGPAPGAGYTAADHQIVLDHAGVVTDYGGGSTRANLAGIIGTAGSARDQNGTLTFVVEARVDAAVIGHPMPFKAGDKVRVNFQINDNGGNNYRIWSWDPNVCTAFTNCNKDGNSEPYCDPRCTSEVVLR